MGMPFYEVLENIMIEKNITIANIASLCNISDSTIRAAIKRKSETVALDIAFKLSKGLNIPLEMINGDIGWDGIESKKGNWTIQELSESPLSDNSIPVELKRGIFANNVNKYMLKNNVSQKDISDMLGVDSSKVSKWLDGDELPNIKTVDALADFLHVKRNNLLDKKNTTYKNNQEKTIDLSADALEVAEAYSALPSDDAKNMIRGALGLSALKKGIISANNVEFSREISASVVDDIAGLLFESDAEKRELSVSPDIKDA